MGFKLCIIAASSNALFSVAHHRAAAERKDLSRYRWCIRRGLRGRNTASTVNRRASQKAGLISELGLLQARQIGNSEKASAENKLVDQRSCRRGCTAMLIQGSAAFLTSFCRNPGSRSKLAIPCRSSVAEWTWIVPPPTRRLSGQ